MGINFTAVKKVLKSAERAWVQFSDNGKFVEVCDGHFLVRMTEKQYKDEGFVNALGTGLPSDKSTVILRTSKKSEWTVCEERLKTGALTKIAEDVQTATATPVYFEGSGKMMRIYKLANGEAVFLDTVFADIIKECYNLVGSKKYGPILFVEGGEVMALVLPVNTDIKEVRKALDFTPTNYRSEPIKVKEVVEDEPLEAPTEEAEEEVEDELDEIPEDEDDQENLNHNDERIIERAKAINIENGEPWLNEDEEVDELDDISDLEEVKAVEGEEPPTVIDGWTVPSDIFIEVTPNGTMWAIGKTKPEKENLKRLGFHYAPKAERAKKAGYPRSAWYRKAEVAAAD